MTVRGRGLAMLATLAMVSATGCDRHRVAAWLAERLPGQRARPEPALVWTNVDPAALVITEEPTLRAVRFSIHLPAIAAARASASNLAALEIGFRDRLDGAKVDARAAGPRHTVHLLDERRFAGDTVVVPLAPLPLTDVEVVVHNHLRPPPVVRQVRLGRRLAVANAGAQPGAQPGARP